MTDYLEAGIEFDRQNPFKPSQWKAQRELMEVDISQIKNYSKDIWVQNWLSEIDLLSLEQYQEDYADKNPTRDYSRPQDRYKDNPNRSMLSPYHHHNAPSRKRIPLDKATKLDKYRQAYISKLHVWQNLFHNRVIRFAKDEYYDERYSRDIIGTKFNKLRDLIENDKEKYVFSRQIIPHEKNSAWILLKGELLNSVLD